MDPKNLKSFGLINDFVTDLNEVFGSKQHSLLLYNCLLGKTSIKNVDSVNKHVTAFTNFVTKNHSAIINKDHSLFCDPIISFSPKVKINMDEIFKMSDAETSRIIWKHLLVITNSVDPSEEAMNILKKSLEEKSKEGEFLTNLVQNIEQSVGDTGNADPISAIMGLMSSGVFSNLIENMTSGNLDMGKMLLTAQGMMSSLKGVPGMEGLGAIPGMSGIAPSSSSSSSSASNSSSASSSSSASAISLEPIQEESKESDSPSKSVDPSTLD